MQQQRNGVSVIDPAKSFAKLRQHDAYTDFVYKWNEMFLRFYSYVYSWTKYLRANSKVFNSYLVRVKSVSNRRDDGVFHLLGNQTNYTWCHQTDSNERSLHASEVRISFGTEIDMVVALGSRLRGCWTSAGELGVRTQERDASCRE